jgi:hypothetical protein
MHVGFRKWLPEKAFSVLSSGNNTSPSPPTDLCCTLLLQVLGEKTKQNYFQLGLACIVIEVRVLLVQRT